MTSTNSRERLSQRLSANAQGARDLNAFLSDLARPAPSDALLDLGCGTGAQTLRFAPLVQSVVALDVSAALLADLATKLGATRNVELVQASMDEAAARLSGRRFEIVVAAYSLYYSTDTRRLIGQIATNLLSPTHGRFVTISPDAGNNAEWYADLGTIFRVPDAILESSQVGRRIADEALDAFDDVRCVRFVNEVRYRTLPELMAYYDGCGAYCPAERRAEAEAIFARIFAEHGGYSIFKRALAVVANR